ncbi:hypothetical protein M8R20_36055 [Pseudomonas sp. R2.Fl]|nr:hypothetical protein [Pseudomonas sp. R2.Fl]
MTTDARRPREPHFAGWRLLMWGGAACLLSLPLIAMQFTDEVNWTPSDFVVFGGMLAVACGACDVAMRKGGNWRYRAGALLAVGTAFLLVWANLAVGFVGSEANPYNLWYAGVLAIGVAGALIARFRPRGMAAALTATAIAQAAVGLVAQFSGMDHPWPATVVFTGLWLVSAGLFHASARLGPRGLS